ncbi:hypothetical protein EJB05_40161 [Eragrostis curvula]|uniref:Uncharacterized protein n=1 Tax=Eragrostis curvula TaxID=38414 RepID=A0A5J9TZ38_9POAL|nr:hypothetical protein EJB05_40161 [Eragrostis curvula]
MAAFVYRKTQALGKIQFIGGPKGFTICRRNEYGIVNLKKKCMCLKILPLSVNLTCTMEWRFDLVCRRDRFALASIDHVHELQFILSVLLQFICLVVDHMVKSMLL